VKYPRHVCVAFVFRAIAKIGRLELGKSAISRNERLMWRWPNRFVRQTPNSISVVLESRTLPPPKSVLFSISDDSLPKNLFQSVGVWQNDRREANHALENFETGGIPRLSRIE
jgi:hypothetical protein